MGHLVQDLLLLARLDSGRELDLTRILLDAVCDARVTGNDHRWLLDLPEYEIHAMDIPALCTRCWRTRWPMCAPTPADRVRAHPRGGVPNLVPVRGTLSVHAIAAALIAAGVRLRGLRVDRPDLEELFVSITGEGFDVLR
jgi:hypothetical protein